MINRPKRRKNKASKRNVILFSRNVYHTMHRELPDPLEIDPIEIAFLILIGI